MNKNNAVLTGNGAILLLLISLPLTWMTIRNAGMQLPSNMSFPSFPGITFKVTGLNGTITFLAQVPIWLIVMVGVIGVALALMNHLGLASVARAVPLLLVFFSAIYIVIAIVVALGSGNASPGIGAFVATLGIVFAFIHAFAAPPAPERSLSF